MHAQMSMELAEQRRQELLRQAERARRVAKARRARSARAGRAGAAWAWRAAAGRILVRAGALASGTALDDSVVVVRRRGRPTAIIVIWSDQPAASGDPANRTRLRAEGGDLSPSRS